MRDYRRLQLQLSPAEDRELQALLKKGIAPVRVLLRALALRQLSAGSPVPTVAVNLNLTPKSVREIGWRYVEGGLDRALYDSPRPGATSVLNPTQKRRILAMVHGNPPPGAPRWTVRLIAEEAVKRRLVPNVGRETIRMLLLNSDVRPWRQKSTSTSSDR